MKKALQGSFILIFFFLQDFPQLLSWASGFIRECNGHAVITTDANQREREFDSIRNNWKITNQSTQLTQ